MNILYIVIGGGINALRYYMEAYLSIRTFQKQLTTDSQIFVLTDNPHLFNRAGVKVLPITQEQKEEWMGPHHFFFRTKIKGIEYLHQHFPNEDLLYLDSDTFLYGNFCKLLERLRQGHGLMHVCEGAPSDISNTARRLWKQVAGRQYAGITIGKHHHMWNAGVIGIPAIKAQEIISTALTICDGMLDDGANTFITEQYANSIAMAQFTSLCETSDLIGHYWGNKQEWEQQAYNIFLQSYFSDYTLEEELSTLDIEELKRIPISMHHSHRGEQLHHIINRLFPNKQKRYVDT